jgi:uncharacterized protein
MQFEWEEAKNIENVRKHEIDFADVSDMFDGPMLIEPDDRFDYGEDRWFGIGVWTERYGDVIRIISARRANRYEQQRFEQYISY